MKILITGSDGFIGRNLLVQLKNIQAGLAKKHGLCSDLELFEYDKDDDISLLDEYAAKCDFVYHLAGINRPQDPLEFMTGNFGFTSTLLDLLKKHNNKATVLVTSSIQAKLDNPYGISKKAGEDLLFAYAKQVDSKVLVYRLPNVFGKWCKPNYNSAVATFCHNIARDLPVIVNDRNVIMRLVYIDDVVNELLSALTDQEHRDGDFCCIPTVHNVKLGEIVDLIYEFRNNRRNLNVPKLDNAFEKALYSTYLSYLPTDQFGYALKMNEDHRGSFTEIIRTCDRGQFSVNISKPGITKGNHWHNTKNEKFVVVSGRALIRFRKIGTTEIIEYNVSGDKIEVVDIPTGYTHNIINIGDNDLVTFMWCNECFDVDNPDTYFEEV